MEDSYKSKISNLEALLMIEKGRNVSVVDDLKLEIIRIKEEEQKKYNQLVINFEKYK